jgi:uncharacterized C2H2 Zn-finger protein
MPKLTIRTQPVPAPKPPNEALVAPRPKPCPRCRVMLVAERSYIAKGLSGQASSEHRFRCPACDALYHFSSRTNRWRELTEDPA